MAGSLDIVVEFLADSSKLQKEAAKVEGTGGKLKTWAKGVGAAIGAAFAVDQIKDWVGAAAGLQDAMSATQQIFGGAAGDVAKFAKGADKGLGISQKQALDAADTFATFGKSAGLTGPPLAKFATRLTGLAGDLASFRGTTPEQAIEAIGAALRGETEPIRAYGVLLDDATLRNQALKMGLIKTTKDALTPQQKVLAAQAQLFAQTGDAQGDFQRTGDSAANQQKILAAQMENTKAALGTALLPALQAILPPIQALAGFIQANAGWLVPLTAAVLGVTAAVWLFNAALAANPIVLITIGIAALIAALILLIKNWDTVWAAIKAGAAAVWAFLQSIWDKILGAIQFVWRWIKTNWPLLLGILTGPFGLALWALWHFRDVILAALGSAIGWLARTWTTVTGYITAPFKAAWDWIASTIGTVVGWFAAVPGKIAGVFSGLTGAITGPFKAAFNAIANIWNSTVGSLSFKIPGWVPGLGGKGFSMPKIPTFQYGGVMPYTGLALLHQGETVIPATAPGPARTGPAVHIENAVFATELDVETFLRRAAWTVRTARV